MDYRIIMQRSGFEAIRVQVETGSFVSPSTEAWWRQIKLAAREYFQLISDSGKLETFKEQVFADLEQFRTAAGISSARRWHSYLGQNPDY